MYAYRGICYTMWRTYLLFHWYIPAESSLNALCTRVHFNLNLWINTYYCSQLFVYPKWILLIGAQVGDSSGNSTSWKPRRSTCFRSDEEIEAVPTESVRPERKSIPYLCMAVFFTVYFFKFNVSVESSIELHRWWLLRTAFCKSWIEVRLLHFYSSWIRIPLVLQAFLYLEQPQSLLFSLLCLIYL